jgi:hypothetical protein
MGETDMPFVPVINSRGPTPASEPVARYRIDFTDMNVPRQVYFTINRPLAAILDWNVGDRIVFGFGVAEDAGMIQLARVDHQKGGNRLHGLSKGTSQFGCSITPPKLIGGFSSHVLLSGVPRAGEVPHEVRNGTLLLIMPRPRLSVVGANVEAA